MAKNGKRGAGDRILESRHLVGLFMGVVLLCGVFFTLGYVMGRTQYGGAVHASPSLAHTAPAAAASPKEKSPDSSASSNSAEWDFYSKKDNNHLEPPAKPASASSASNANGASGEEASANGSSSGSMPHVQPGGGAPKPPANLQPPKMLKGSLILQIAALSHESDAIAMADALQRKKFPAFVVAASADNLYRVQVGPYSDEHAMEDAKNALDHDGFQAITKR